MLSLLQFVGFVIALGQYVQDSQRECSKRGKKGLKLLHMFSLIFFAALN